MKILLLGPQGSGKGTVGKILSEKLGIPLIGVGKLLREMSVDHPKFEEVQETMNKGEPVSQEFIAELLKELTSTTEMSNGYLLDGWGRHTVDLKHFDPGFDKVLYITLSRDSSVKRISGRRICQDDGSTCNIYTLPPQHEGHCDLCGGKLVQREDDTEEAVNRRLDIFYSETMEVIEHFRQKGILIEVDGEPMPDEVAEEALSKLSTNDKN